MNKQVESSVNNGEIASLTMHKQHKESCCQDCRFYHDNCNERGQRVVHTAKKKVKDGWNYKILNCTAKVKEFPSFDEVNNG